MAGKFCKLLVLFFFLGGFRGHAETTSPLLFSDSLVQNAESGDPAAQLRLARCYLEGLGTEKNPEKAFQWYKKSAEQNHAVSQSELGVCYREGRGVAKDLLQAKAWFEKSAAQNNSYGLACLGEFYEYGWGNTPVDLARAIELYQKAADQNYPWAQHKVAKFYGEGIGIEKNPTKAFEMTQKAAESGFPPAQAALAWLYYTGKTPGSNQARDPRKPSYRKNDYQKAFEWYLKSAEQGNRDAQFNLALMYWRGEGTEVDLEKAKTWMAKAAEKEDPTAKQALGWIKAKQHMDKTMDQLFSPEDDSQKEVTTHPQQNP